MALLKVEDLRTYIAARSGTVRAVDGVSFDVDEGEVLGIVGESGSGKTMTGMSIMRMLPPGGRFVGGRIVFGDQDLMTLSEKEMQSIRGRDIAVVFQDPMTSLNPNMRIGEQIVEVVRAHNRVSKKAALGRAIEVLGLVRFPDPAARVREFPHQLSGGLRQRVMIAIALACNPRLVIADEPTTALDVSIQAQILDLLQGLVSELGMALLLITHDMGVIAGRTDRVVVMYGGRVVESAATDELFDHTRHPYTEALLASIPQLDQDVGRRLYSIPGVPVDLANPPPGCRFAPRCAYADERCTASEPSLGGLDRSHAYACFKPRNMSREGGSGVIEVVAGIEAMGSEAGEARAGGAEDGGGDVVVDVQEVWKEFRQTFGGLTRGKGGGVVAVAGVSVRLRRGETVGLVGESGCGKTTLGRLAAGLEAPSGGRVIFEGVELSGLRGEARRKVRRNLQFMFQDPYASLDPRMRIRDIVREPLDIQEVGTREERRLRVREVLDEVGIGAELCDSYPHEFSGGQRQRIGLARALALNPKVIVADEPVSALDVSIRSQVLNLMKAVQGKHSLTYLIISHDLSVIRYVADRVAVMYLGKLVEIGSREEIFERAAHPYTAGLLRSIPIPRPCVERAKSGPGLVGELPSPRDPPSGCRFHTRCPFAQARCAEEEPVVRSFGGQHFAACHFPLQSPVGASVVVRT